LPTVGLYVHIPFCERVCPYCDFAVVAVRKVEPELEARYVAALIREIESRAVEFEGAQLDTVYFGGGTPSLFRPEALAKILEAATRAFAASTPPREITLEVNPSTVERDRLPAFRSSGIDRISLGVQSFDDATLKRLGRAHKAHEARQTFTAARQAGFGNVSLDLILACPHQGFDAFARDLEEALALEPEHLSLYELTIEAGTPFEFAASRDQLAPPDDEVATRMLEHTAARSAGAGFERYEISNYARPGFASLHNQRYWAREAVLGVGTGAWSYEAPGARFRFGARRMNPRDLGAYFAAVGAGGDEGVESEVLTLEQARGEAIFLSLRRRTGVDARAFEAEFGGRPRKFYDEQIDRLMAAGLLAETESGDLRLSDRGLLLSDTVFADFV
jgi:oxygen-independent coproporphyrinogen-3 oxidase